MSTHSHVCCVSSDIKLEHLNIHVRPTSMSSHVDSDEPPAKRQRCTKNKTHAWNVQNVCELTQKPCHCNGGAGDCFKKFKGLECKVADLRMKLKALPPGEADLTVVNMMYGASEVDLLPPHAEDDRVSDESDQHEDLVGNSDHIEESDGRVESETNSRVDSSHESRGDACSSRQGGNKKQHPRRRRKARYAHKVLGVSVCSRAMVKILGSHHPALAGKRRAGGRRS